MNNDDNKSNLGSSSSSSTTSSGTSGHSGYPRTFTKTTGTSGTLKTTSTIDHSHINDSTANENFEIAEPDSNRHVRKPNRKLDPIMVMAIVFQIVLWGAITILAYLAMKFLSLHTFSPVITSISNSIKTPQQGFPNQLILGIFSSIFATIAVLITREMFYYIRDRLPAGALFRNIARVVSDPCLIFTLRMKDTTQSGNFITPIPNFSAVHDQTENQHFNEFEDRTNTPWVTSTPEAQSLAFILNVLGRVGRTENIEVTFPDKEYDRWDAPMFSLGGNWKTMRAFETCQPYFKFKNDAFVLLPTKEHFIPSSIEEDMGLLQKMINPNNGLPVWIVMGYRGAGTVSASYALSRWWKYLGILYGAKTFGILVAFDDRDGWQQSHIVSLYPKPKWHTILRHPYAWQMLRKRMRDS